MFMKRVCLAAVAVAAIACASKAASSSTRQNAANAPSGNPDIITAQALADPSVNNADVYEAIRRLRPRFLTGRGSGSIQDPSAGSVHVSVDGGPLVTVDYLRRMRVTEVSEIQYLNATEATQRFGTAAGTGGVILVKGRR